MTLPRFGHRALPTAGPGEDAVDNERRHRAELERALSRGDAALRTLDRVIAAGISREDVEALIAAARLRGVVEAEYTNRFWNAQWYEIASFRSTGSSTGSRDQPNYVGTIYVTLHWSTTNTNNAAFHIDFGFHLAGNSGSHMDLRHSYVVLEVNNTNIRNNSSNGAAISIVGPRGANSANLADVTIKGFTGTRNGTVLQTVNL